MTTRFTLLTVTVAVVLALGTPGCCLFNPLTPCARYNAARDRLRQSVNRSANAHWQHDHVRCVPKQGVEDPRSLQDLHAE